MKPIDIFLLILIAAIIIFAVRLTADRRKNGSACCGDCGRCQENCHSVKERDEK